MNRPALLIGLVAIILILDVGAFAATATDPAYLPVQQEPQSGSGEIVIVRRGDHLWKISKQYLRDSFGTEPSDDELSPYWRSAIETNITNLRSGDPDLIYPGEKLKMPIPVIGSR